MNIIRNICRLQSFNLLISNNIKVLVQNDYTNIIIPCHIKSFSTHKISNDASTSQPNQKKRQTNKFQLKDDPDMFGTLNSAKVIDDDELDSGDKKEEEYLKNPRRRTLNTKQYAILIKDHLNNNRLFEAINILEKKMIEEDRAQPENYIFNLLIAGCAKAGNTKKAFQLFTRMKQRGLKVTGGTYTSLFNACANSPWLNDCLLKANRLREIMIEKGYEPNETNYNAMIKAYGRGGDIKTAFQLVDEMSDKNLEIKLETFNFLLQACASDKEHGFRHSLIVWRKMHRRKLNPDIYSFNLLLRCVRDSGIGDLETTEKVLKQLLVSDISKQLPQPRETVEELDSKLEISNASSDLVPSQQVADCTPNLISLKPRLGNLVAISEITKPEDRLLLIGGITGFMDEMKSVKVTPNINTVTELLEVAPSTLSAEKKILSFIRKIGLKTDIDFFNILIKKRSMRFDYASAREVLSMIQTAKLKPDIITYGVLALGCQTYEEAQDLIAQMTANGIKINIQILGAMVRQGCYKKNFDYIFGIIELMKREKIKPNDQFIKHLDAFAGVSRSLIKQKHPSANKTFRNNFNRFLSFYDAYLNELDVKGLSIEEAMQKLKGKPYDQFKEPSKTGYEPNKNEGLLQKRKPMKYISKIKVENLKDDENVVKFNE